MFSAALNHLPPIPPRSAFVGGSGPAATSDAVLNAVDLSVERRDVFGLAGSANPDDRQDFLQMLATLLRQGIVGTETRDLNGRPVQRFITTSIGDESLRGLPYYRGPDAGAGFNRVV